MIYQNGNVAGTLFSLYDELMVAKATLESKLVHSPGWLQRRTKHKKRGSVSELYYVFLENGKRRYQKIDSASEDEYLTKIALLQNNKKALKYVNEQLHSLSKCFVVLGIDPGKRQKQLLTKTVSSTSIYPENLRHRTLNGEMVRSKSEVLLANLLYFYQIPYEYEKPINFGNYTIYPDFTIILPTGQQIYWEHLGMLNTPKYAKSWAEKNHTYRQNGISEGNGLIITKDVNGVFDEQDALLKIQSYHLSPLLN